MVNKSQLAALGKSDITKRAKEQLLDISAFEITGKAVSDRLVKFISAAKNPYCFRVGKTPVKIVFPAGDAPSAENLLVNIAIDKMK